MRSMTVEIREALSSDRQDWDRFLESQPTATFYHRFGWHDVIARCFAHRTLPLIACDEGLVVGVLPLVLVSSRLFGRILCSVPFMNYGGPCAVTGCVAKQLVDAAIDKAGDLGADYLELRCAQPLDSDMPVSLRKISMTIPLGADPDAIWNAFTAKHRKNVRRAYKNELTVRNGGAELLAEFYAVLERSWRDHGTPLYRIGYFREIFEAFAEDARIYLCDHNGSAVAAALVGFHNGTAEGMWQGGLPDARELQANYVLYWEMIRDTALRGCRSFHLGRSTSESGSEQFKSRWNAESRQLYWYFHRPDGGPMPALNVDNPRYRLAIAVWRRLPLWATRALGPTLARGIP